MDRRNQITSVPTPARAGAVPFDGRRGGSDGAGTPDVGGASRAALAAWLTAGRTVCGLTREHVARVTRIQQRTIERLEEGRFDELPADVFVRGFIRNYARCVGLSVDDALARYAACGFAAAPVASPQAHALLESMAPLAPLAARTSSVVVVPAAPRVLQQTAPETVVVAAPAAPVAVAVAVTAVVDAPRSRRVRDSKGRFRRQAANADPDANDLDANDDDLEVEITIEDYVAAADALLADELVAEAPLERAFERRVETSPATVVVVRPPASTATSTSISIPTLSIDDDDPDAAERELDERARRDKDSGWRSFLPPALLDQDRGRQGGLTLAVIILLIVATLTLSYLMRRPSSSGEGVTQGAAIPTHVA